MHCMTQIQNNLNKYCIETLQTDKKWALQDYLNSHRDKRVNIFEDTKGKNIKLIVLSIKFWIQKSRKALLIPRL